MESHLNSIKTNLQENCSKLQKEIHELQSELETSDGNTFAENEKRLMQHKLHQLQCELEVQENHQDFAHCDSFLTSVNLLEELTTISDKTKQLLEMHSSQLEILGEATQRLDADVLCQEQLQTALLKRLEDLEQVTQNKSKEQRAKEYEQQLKAQKSKCDEEVQALKKDMKIFSETQFPTPSTKKMHTSSMSVKDMLSQKKFVSLDKIVNDLISLLVSQPEDPYLVLGLQHWPEHVELLLKYGIACRHPSDVNRIKMTDMHL